MGISGKKVVTMQCQKCGNQIAGPAYPSPLGEQLCAGCHDQVVGLVLGSQQGGLGAVIGLAGTDRERPNGLLAWIRSALRRDRG